MYVTACDLEKVICDLDMVDMTVEIRGHISSFNFQKYLYAFRVI